jgi:hypothetical protein
VCVLPVGEGRPLRRVRPVLSRCHPHGADRQVCGPACSCRRRSGR